MYIQVSCDDLIGRSSSLYGIQARLGIGDIERMLCGIQRALREHTTGGSPFEVHEARYEGYVSYHVSTYVDSVAGDALTKELARVAKYSAQDAFAVIFGSLLVGPGSDAYPTAVKP